MERLEKHQTSILSKDLQSLRTLVLLIVPISGGGNSFHLHPPQSAIGDETAYVEGQDLSTWWIDFLKRWGDRQVDVIDSVGRIVKA